MSILEGNSSHAWVLEVYIQGNIFHVVHIQESQLTLQIDMYADAQMFAVSFEPHLGRTFLETDR